LCRDWNKASQLEIVTTTLQTPSLPYITASKNDAKKNYQNLKRAILEIGKKGRKSLQIFGLVNIADQNYMKYSLSIAP
jgi:hypothetical protein